MRFPRPSCCSYSRRGGTIDSGRPGGEGERGGGLGEPGETGGGGWRIEGSRRTEGGPIVIVVPPWDSPARAGKGVGESGTRKPCSSSSSGVAARAFPHLISLALSSSANSITVNLRALAFLYVFFFLHIFFGTTSGTLIGIYISSLRRSAAVINLDSLLRNYPFHLN